jgi:hypothetical protein
LLLVLALFLVGRYGALPAIGFTLDDWWHLNLADSRGSLGALLLDAVRYPLRPLHTVTYMLAFRLIGEHPAGFIVLCTIGFSIFLFLALALARKLTGSGRSALVTGLLCALWPGYHEMFYWPTVMLYSIWSAVFALLLWTWAGFIEKPGPARYAFAVGLYGVLIAMYEIYLPVPAALAVLIPWNRNWFRRAVRLMIPFAGLAALYLSYRMTNAYGHGMNMFGTGANTAASFAANLWEIRHNLMSMASWFAGFQLVQTGWNGLLGLGGAGPWSLAALAAADAALAIWAWRALQGGEARADSVFKPAQVAAFGLVLAAGFGVILVLTYAAGRNLFPAAAGVFLAASLLGRSPWRRTAWVVPVVFVALLATQGMGRNWGAAARVQREFKDRLAETRSQWIDRDVLLVDTAGLRQAAEFVAARESYGDFYVLVEYRGAGFLRGFGPAQIAARVAGRNVRPPRVLLDYEHGARFQGGELVWHERFQPAAPHRTPRDRVHIETLGAGGMDGRGTGSHGGVPVR